MYRHLLTSGTRVLVTGKVSAYAHVQMVHPMIERLPEDGTRQVADFFPLYPISEPMREAGINHRLLMKAVRWLLGNITRFPRVLPEPIVKKHNFPLLEECLRQVHLPGRSGKT